MADIWERVGGQRGDGTLPSNRQIPTHQFWALCRFVQTGDLTKQQALTVLTNAGYTFDGQEQGELNSKIDILNVEKGEAAAMAREVGWITLAQMKTFVGI